MDSDKIERQGMINGVEKTLSNVMVKTHCNEMLTRCQDMTWHDDIACKQYCIGE